MTSTAPTHQSRREDEDAEFGAMFFAFSFLFFVMGVVSGIGPDSLPIPPLAERAFGLPIPDVYFFFGISALMFLNSILAVFLSVRRENRDSSETR